MPVRSWSPEQRAAQAAAIHQWQPWASSTGPKTRKGKAVASRNSDRGGQRQALRAEAKQINALLRAHRDMLVEVGRA